MWIERIEWKNEWRVKLVEERIENESSGRKNGKLSVDAVLFKYMEEPRMFIAYAIRDGLMFG